VQTILLDRIGMREMVIGHDHHFGRGRTGDENFLLHLADELGFSVDVVPAQVMNDCVVSSSEIRRMIVEEGNVSKASEQLGYPYGFSATVVEGLRRGRQIGFPTANLVPIHARKIIPSNGVYAVTVRIAGETAVLVGMMNIGHRPTFEDTGRHIEVHIIDYDGELYGETVRVEFISRIRSERKFDNLEALIAQLHADRERCISFAEMRP